VTRLRSVIGDALLIAAVACVVAARLAWGRS
jgi:hypothetical protein